jgi:magnesium transporter
MMPITVVASVYGMNVTLPFQNSDYAFLYVILITLAIIGGMLYFFKRIHII